MEGTARSLPETETREIDQRWGKPPTDECHYDFIYLGDSICVGPTLDDR